MKLSLLLTVLLGTSAFGQRIVVVDDAPRKDIYASPALIQATIYLQESPQTYREASFDDVFFNGQRFRLQVTPTQNGYLYMLCENSQGSAVVLYPNDSSASGNHVRAARPVTVPGRSWFQFDEDPGTERVYVILSRRPIPELERASQRGGDLNPQLLDRYAGTQSSDAKGIVRTADPDDYLVREIDLRHEQR
jgi:Domain of unknown function (DUF4384)